MNEGLTTEDFVNKYKEVFGKLSPIKNNITGEPIFFNMVGFKHLIFKGKHRRATKVIVNRLILVPLIVPTIKNAPEILETRIRKETIDGKRIEVTYHALEAHVGKKSVRVRVVVRKVGKKGRLFFFSIMKY